MALVLEISEQSYDRATHIATFSDDTGIYNVTTNPGGYGTPNAERNTLALILSATRIDGSELTQWSDPLTDTTFDFDFLQDGSYDVRLCSVEFEAGAYDPTVMSVGRVFYSVLDDKLYKVIDTTGVNTIIETNDLLANAIESSLEFNYLVKSRTETRSISIFCASMEDDCNCLKNEYFDIQRGLDSVQCYFDQESYSKVNEVFTFLDKISI